MTIISTRTSSFREGSETAFSSAETITSEGSIHKNVITAAATDNDPFALVIAQQDLAGMYWSADGDCRLRLVAETPLILAYTVAGPPGEFTITGDYSHIPKWAKFSIVGSTSNDGIYTCQEIAVAGGVSTIHTVEAIPAVEAVAASTVRFFRSIDAVLYPVTAVGAGAGGTFQVDGVDLTALNENRSYFAVDGSTNNDLSWEIDTAVLVVADTVLTVVGTETVNALADGDIYLVTVDKVFDLLADVSQGVYSIADGMDNPLITNVTGGELTNESATDSVDLIGRIATA